MVALAGFLGAIITLRLTQRDRADVRSERRALIAAYVGALLGGYVLEWLRVLPLAIAEGSWSPLLQSGRAAYGGLIFGVLSAVVVLRRSGAPALPFLDRTVPLLGITYGLVRTGCFLAGCDYGIPTAGSLGVRFPPGSPAALQHAALGWVPRGASSLPVHPTQLYEAALGLLAGAIASMWLLGARRDGRAFATWVGLYATGRFFLELLRGDEGRGTIAGLSSAQFVSILLLCAIVAGLLLAHRARTPALPALRDAA
jgi:prolipoprotein diacylglyceryltransferase